MATNVVDTETTDADGESADSGESDESVRSQTESTQESGETETTSDVSITAHLRMSPTGVAAHRQQAVLGRLQELDADGTIPDLTVERWGARVSVPASGGGDDAGAVDLYEEFERAADEYDLQLEPFFEARQAVGGLLSSGPPTERILVFPVVSITIRRDGDLTGLYPCWNDGVHHSVEDCLDTLECGEPVENL